MLGKLKQDYTPFPSADPRVQLPSPARALQMSLEALTAPLPEEEKWSARRSLAFMVASASTLWLAIIAAGATAVHAFT